MYHVSRTDSHYVYFLVYFVEGNLIILLLNMSKKFHKRFAFADRIRFENFTCKQRAA